MSNCVLPADAYDAIEKLRDRNVPQPTQIAWVNLENLRPRRRQSIEMLLRTRTRQQEASESVRELHRSTGLMLQFRDASDQEEYLVTLRRSPVNAAKSA